MEKLNLGEFASFYNGKAISASESGNFVVFGSNGPIGYCDEPLYERGVIVGRVGAYCGSIEISERPFWATDNTIVLYNKENSDLKFIYYLLRLGNLNNFAGGAAQPLLTQGLLSKLGFAVPTLPVQRRIAEVLGRYDELIENYNRQIGILESTARDIYREWYVRGRCPHAVYEKGVKSPVGWDTVKLGTVMALKYGKSLIEEERDVGEFPVVGSSGIIDFHNRYLVESPGLVVGRKGNVGSVFWMDRPFYPIDTAFYVESSMSLYYLFFNLQTQNFISGDAAVPGLNREQALSNPIIKPADEVLENFDGIIKPIFSKLSNLREQSKKLRHMRDKLLPRLLSGKLPVNVAVNQKISS